MFFLTESAKYYYCNSVSSGINSFVVLHLNSIKNYLFHDRHNQLRCMIELLVQRGADPDKSTAPFLTIFFAVKAGDTDAVRLLLEKGASPNVRLSDKVGFSNQISRIH